MKSEKFCKYINGLQFQVGETMGSRTNLDFNLLMIYFEALGKKYNPRFFIDPKDLPIFDALFHYYTGDKEYCEVNNINLNKGLLLVGGNGVGKSTIIKMFSDFFREIKVKSHSVFTLAQRVSTDGLTALDSINFKRDFILDDIGSEMESVYFNVRAEIFESILMKFESVNFPVFKPDEESISGAIQLDRNISNRKNPKMPARIFASTNLSLDKFEERYGIRIYSRIASFFNVISFPTSIDKRIASANVIEF